MSLHVCVCVGVGQQHLPACPARPAPPAPPTALSRFIICSPAPRCSSTSWPLWIHLLLLFSTDNWLEQWNAFETQHPVYFPEVSFLLSFPPSYPLSPLNFSLSLLLSTCVTSVPPPPPPPTHLRELHMKIASLTGHISMCHSASDASLWIFWRGSGLLFFVATLIL